MTNVRARFGGLLPLAVAAFVIGTFLRLVFAWGALGAVIGQIHMAGFFFTPALVVWTKLFSTRSAVKKTSWAAWLAGSIAGAFPAISWLLYLARDRPPATSSPWWLRFRLEFYQYFLSDPLSLSGEYVLGDDIWRAMRWPLAFGHSTWLVLFAHGVLTVVALRLGLTPEQAKPDGHP